TLYKLSETEI
ncbi:unnamed protein product, partial [Allacma fusca]